MTAVRPRRPRLGLEANLARWGRVAVVVVLVVAALDWMGWATGIEGLTRVYRTWPQMVPWTALWLAGSAAAILVQTGQPSRVRVRAGRGMAVVVGVSAVAVLAEYVSGRSLGLDQVWFGDAVRTLQSSWPGRPSPLTAASVLLLAAAVALTRVDRRWICVVWSVCVLGAGVLACVGVVAYVFGAMSLVGMPPSTGLAIATALAVLLLVVATLVARLDRPPLAWLLGRPDGIAVLRLYGLAVGFVILVALSRLAFLALGCSQNAAFAFSLAVGMVMALVGGFRLRHQEQSLLKDHAEAEMHYHILADNAVDILGHLRGRKVVWMSPSVEAAFGWPREQWIGTDITSHRVHADDVGAVATLLREVAVGKSAAARLRVSTADGCFRWVEARGKPYIDAKGNTDGMIFASRLIDEQVAAEQQFKTDRERFEAVVANAPSAISVRDLQLRYTLVNEAFCQMFGGKSVGDVIGRTQDEVLPPDVVERSKHAAVRQFAGDNFVEEESISVGGENISVMTQRFSLRNSAGAIAELATVRTDITHRKKVEQAAAERAMWAERIGAAIIDGRLMVYSQPIVDIATRQMVDEELLVRLRAVETEEILPPNEFLPQCERHGLMPLIDRYMVGRAIDLARIGRHVSVNISADTIGDETTRSEIFEALAAAGPAVTDHIMFEITETTALGSPAIAKTFSQGMRKLGCQVALDDFGTGYGTFTDLRLLDLNELKIDQSFVKNMLRDSDDERAVSTIAYVARTYGLTTVAEGVETEETLDRLAVLGVDRAQGYVFGQPTPIVV